MHGIETASVTLLFIPYIYYFSDTLRLTSFLLSFRIVYHYHAIDNFSQFFEAVVKWMDSTDHPDR